MPQVDIWFSSFSRDKEGVKLGCLIFLVNLWNLFVFNCVSLLAESFPLPFFPELRTHPHPSSYGRWCLVPFVSDLWDFFVCLCCFCWDSKPPSVGWDFDTCAFPVELGWGAPRARSVTWMEKLFVFHILEDWLAESGLFVPLQWDWK